MRDSRNHLKGFVLSVLTCLTLYGCQGNPFQTKIYTDIYNQGKNELVNVELEETDTSNNSELQGCSKGSEKAFILIHGIYGDSETFGDLPKFLLADYENSCVFVFSYWSSGFLPNFQRLGDLGTEFVGRIKHIQKLNPEEIIIIAHSQGGLVAKDAILKIGNGQDDRILKNMKLVIVGTPNYGSEYATLNNLIVNSIFAPATYAFSLLTSPFGNKAYIYNRQAYDMSKTRFDFLRTRESPYDIASFSRNLIMRWGETFPAGVNGNGLKLYAIMGVRNLFDGYDLSDGVVHSTNVLFAGVPENRYFYVPYKHFGDEIDISTLPHYTYDRIQDIVGDRGDLRDSKQKISPFKNLPFSYVTFVKDNGALLNVTGEDATSNSLDTRVDIDWVDIDTEQIINVEQPITKSDEEEKSTGKKILQAVKKERGSLLEDFLRICASLIVLPFEILQSFNKVPVIFEEIGSSSSVGKPPWQALTAPTLMVDGGHPFKVHVTRIEEVPGWIWGTREKEVDGVAEGIILDDPQLRDRQSCDNTLPIFWEDNKKEKPKPTIVKIHQNSVNFLKVEAFHDSEELKVQLQGC